jgi:GlpG protein
MPRVEIGIFLIFCETLLSFRHEEKLLRHIGTLNNSQQAERLRWYLLSRSIEVKVEGIEANDCDIWVLKDQDRHEAKRILEEFVLNPQDERFARGESIARAQIQRAAVQVQATRKRQVKTARGLPHQGQAPVTYALIGGSVLFYVLHFFDKTGILFRLLLISQDTAAYRVGGAWLPEVRQGEVWRLFTPAFIHTSFLHILFNLLWLYQLGRAIEGVLGTWRTWILVLLTGAVSNVVFYGLISPLFGGMSGVVYGMFYFMWAADRFYPRPVFYVDEGMIRFFTIFYVISWFLSVVGLNAANTIHSTGAVVGIALAYVFSGRLTLALQGKARWNMQSVYIILIGIALWIGGVVADFLTASH